MKISNLVPTPEEMTEMKDLEGVRAWAKVTKVIWKLVLQGLGDPTSLEEVVFIEKRTWDAVIEKTVVPANALGQGKEESDISGVEQGRLAKARNGIRYIYGLRADTELVPEAEKLSPGSAVASGQKDTTTTAPDTLATAIKLSTLVDVTMEAKLIPLQQATIDNLFREYADQFGGLPTGEMEPSDDQVSAVKMILDSGAPPYVDFALFGPHGRRAVRRLMYTVQTWNQETNKYIREKLMGPCSFELWWKCWTVLKVVLIMLGAVKTTPLDQYGEFIRELVTAFTPECWWIIYQADTRMRSEGMERIRRSAEIEYNALAPELKATAKYDPTKPWNEVFRRAALEGTAEVTAFWQKEVHHKCMMYLTKSASTQRIAHDGTVIRRQPGAHAQEGDVERGPDHSKRASGQDAWGPKKKKQRVNKKKKSWDQSQQSWEDKGSSAAPQGSGKGGGSHQQGSKPQGGKPQGGKGQGGKPQGGKPQGGKEGKGKSQNGGKGGKPQFNQWG